MPPKCHLFFITSTILSRCLTFLRSDKDTAWNLTIPRHGPLEGLTRETPHSFNDNTCNRTIVGFYPLNPARYSEKSAFRNRILGNRTRIPHSGRCVICGFRGNQYSHADLIKRIAVWLVPIFMLVGHFQSPSPDLLIASASQSTCLVTPYTGCIVCSSNLRFPEGTLHTCDEANTTPGDKDLLPLPMMFP